MNGILFDSFCEQRGDVQPCARRRERVQQVVPDGLVQEGGDEAVSFAVDLASSSQMATEVTVGDEARHRSLLGLGRLPIGELAQLEEVADDRPRQHRKAESQQPGDSVLENVST